MSDVFRWLLFYETFFKNMLRFDYFVLKIYKICLLKRENKPFLESIQVQFKRKSKLLQLNFRFHHLRY